MLGKVKSMISQLRVFLINAVWWKGGSLSFEGAGLSDPITSAEYNIDSVTRSGIGVYDIMLTQETFYGIDVVDFGIPTLTFDINTDANTELHAVKFAAIAGGARVTVLAVVQGTGNRLDFDPYDIEAGDHIHMSLMVNAGVGGLPPE